jgi:hypothetical protein
MAGAGKKTFTAGEVLTASDVNTYLMEQSVMVFGGTAARSSAIPTPSEGMTTYRTDSQQIESYDGAEWRGMSGLQLVKKQTIGSGVSSVSVTGAFSATYENYLIKVSGGSASLVNEFSLQLNGISTNVYFSGLSYGAYNSTTAQWAGNNGVSFWQWVGSNSGSNLMANIEVDSPFLTKAKNYRASIAGQSSGLSSGRSQGFCDSSLSATGFTLTLNGGTITGGTIYVYGYGV